MLKGIGIVLFILCMVVLVSGCVSEEQSTKKYSSNGVSFNYSASWVEANVQFPDNVTESKVLVNLVDPSDPETGFCVEYHPVQYDNDLDSNMGRIIESYEDSGYQILSKNESSIGGEKAYEIFFTMNSGNDHIKQKDYWCEHNGSFYTIAFFSTPENFENSQKSFDTVIKSFKFT